jgi:hypothetical protein
LISQSRGLGDVYKRQLYLSCPKPAAKDAATIRAK